MPMMIDEDKSNIIFYTSFYLERKTIRSLGGKLGQSGKLFI